MPLPRWSSEFSLGDATVDAEHQHLFDLLLWLEQELVHERDMNAAKVHTLVKELNAHVEEHFHHEESLMEGLRGMPDQVKATHRDDHRRWKVRIKEHLAPLLRAPTDLERRAHLARILVVGKAFWREHFHVHDKALAEFTTERRG